MRGAIKISKDSLAMDVFVFVFDGLDALVLLPALKTDMTLPAHEDAVLSVDSSSWGGLRLARCWPLSPFKRRSSLAWACSLSGSVLATQSRVWTSKSVRWGSRAWSSRKSC